MAKIIGSHIPAELRNLAINGAMDFWQAAESTTTSIVSAALTVASTADCFGITLGGTTSKVCNIIRSTSVPTLTQSGFNSTYSYLFTMTTGIASPAASDFLIPIYYKMEGLDYEKLHNGKTVTFGFWVMASVAGTYNFSLNSNAATQRSYATTFAITTANAWQYITISVVTDTIAPAGFWNFDNTSGMQVNIGAITGTTSQTATVNTWQTGFFVAATGTTNWQATSGATLQIAQFSIVEGPLGLGAKGFARLGGSIQQELALCQRYFEKSYDQGTIAGTSTANGAVRFQNGSAATSATLGCTYAVAKRAAATVTPFSVTGTINAMRNTTAATDVAAGAAAVGGQHGFGMDTSAAGVAGVIYMYQWTADARL